MDVEKIAEMAQAVAELDRGSLDYFEGMLADARSAIAADLLRAKLKEMPDEDALWECLLLSRFVLGSLKGSLCDMQIKVLLGRLEQAGFERFPAKPTADRLTQIIIDGSEPFGITGPNVNDLISFLRRHGHEVAQSKSA